MGGPIIVRQSETDIHRIIRNNIKKELKRQAKLNIVCSYNLAMVLFMYEIDKVFWEKSYYEIDSDIGTNPYLTDEPIDKHGNYDRELYFPVFTMHEAKYFMREYLDIDIAVHPVMVIGKKMYGADIWVKGKQIRHKKWSYMFYDTPEAAFEEASLHILLFREINKLKEPALMVGKRVYCSTLYTMYVNNLDTYFHLIPIHGSDKVVELPDLYKNKQ